MYMEVTNRGKLYSKYRDQIFRGAYKSELLSTSSYKPRHLIENAISVKNNIKTNISEVEKNSIKYNLLYKENFKNKQLLMFLIIFSLLACFILVGIFVYR